MSDADVLASLFPQRFPGVQNGARPGSRERAILRRVATPPIGRASGQYTAACRQLT
jgi:hypothetical protein